MENGKENKGAKAPDLKKLGKKAAGAAAGAGLAASLLVGSVFASPQDIVGDDPVAQPAAIVQTVELNTPFPGEAPAEAQTEEKRGLAHRLCALLMRMPVAVRAAVLVPLWAVGWGLIHAVGLLSSLIALPVVGTILKFLLGAAIVLGLIICGLKLLFPEVPLKKLLGKRNLWGLAVCVGVIALAGALAGAVWPAKPWITPLVDLGAAALYLAYFCLFVRKPKKA